MPFSLLEVNPIGSIPEFPKRRSDLDNSQIDFFDLSGRRESISYVVSRGTALAATAFGVFWVAPDSGFLIECWETHAIAATAGSVTIEKLGRGVAPGSGTAMLTAGINFTSTANNPNRGTALFEADRRNFRRGDRLAARVIGPTTNLEDVTIVAIIEYT